MPRNKLTPWQKIIRARDRGTGLRLSADEVHRLGFDGAIETRAGLDDWNEAGLDDDGNPIDPDDHYANPRKMP